MGLSLQIRKTYYELTAIGFVFAGVTAFVLIAAVNSQTNVLFWALGIVLGSILVSAIMGNVLLKKLEVVRVVGDHAVVGEAADVQYRLTNRKRLWPSCAIRMTEARMVGRLRNVPEGYCLHLGPQQSTLVMTHLVPEGRGLVELRELRICCSFPFGFVNRAIHYLAPQRIVVYPRIGLLNRRLLAQTRTFSAGGSVTSSARGGFDEFYGLRDYHPGDSARSIHWRRTARTGEIMVREMTIDTPPTMIVVLDLRTWRTLADGRAQCERGIELAAALICAGLMDNLSVGLCVAGYADMTPTIVKSGRGQRGPLMETLALLNLDKVSAAAAVQPAGQSEFLRTRAEYMIINLTSEQGFLDMVPPGCQYTVLSMDDPESSGWLRFNSPDAPSEESPVGGSGAAEVPPLFPDVKA